MKKLIKEILTSSNEVKGLILIYIMLFILIVGINIGNANAQITEGYKVARVAKDTILSGQETDILDFSDYFMYIKSDCYNENSLLEWELYKNTGYSYFDIEGSLNGKEWNVVYSQDIFPDQLNFRYEDTGNKLAGLHYVRVSLCDGGSRKNYSKTLPVTCAVTPKESISVFPNPASDYIKIRVVFEEAPIPIQIVNYEGEVILEKPVDKTNNKILLNGLADGNYVVRATLKDHIMFKRIMIR